MYENSNLTINTKTLRNNINAIFSNLDKATVIPVLKANAYGHGLVEIAKIVSQDKRIKRLAVAHISEAILLRENNITLPIMVLGSLQPEAFQLARDYNIEVTIYNQLSLENAINLNLDYHLKIDSGLHRLGFKKDALKDLPNIQPISTYSHFIDGLSVDSKLSHQQHQYFLDCLDILKDNDINPGFTHICDSGAYEWFEDAHHDAVRIGRALYMDNPLKDENTRNKDVGTWTASITQISILEKHTPLGYNQNTYDEDLTVGILNVGYGDGAITKNMPVLVNGVVATVLDSAMDQSYINLSNIDARINDTVEIFGENFSSNIYAKSINDEGCVLTTTLSTRVKRIYTL